MCKVPALDVGNTFRLLTQTYRVLSTSSQFGPHEINLKLLFLFPGEHDDVARCTRLCFAVTAEALPRRKLRPASQPDLEQLSAREVPAVVASFSAGTLSIFGDNLDNNITISRDAAGKILVNGGAVNITGGTSTVANTSLIQVFGQAGNDVITLNEATGRTAEGEPVRRRRKRHTHRRQRHGSDLRPGRERYAARQGRGRLPFGGTENDTLTGGDADDQVFGEAGDDRMIWNPGDDTDLNEGGRAPTPWK